MAMIFIEEPFVIDVDVHDIDLMLSRMRERDYLLRTPFTDIGYGVFARQNTPAPDGAPPLLEHDVTRTAAAMLAASAVYDRIGKAVAAAVRAQIEDEPPREIAEYIANIPANGPIVFLPAFDAAVLDLSRPFLTEAQDYCLFDVTAVALGSFDIRAMLRGIVISVALNVPAAAPAAAAPTVWTVVTAIGAGATGAATVGAFGFSVYVYQNDKHLRLVEEQAAYLAKSASSGDWRPLQRHLQELGFYRGPIDGKVGPDTRKAITDFCAAKGLPGGLGMEDPRFLKALAYAVTPQ